jgi:sigma-B regulation protein RsbU (phosphoserine phosphatase)
VSQNNPKQIILVVDDTPANIDVVKGVLSDQYLVQAAVNGKMTLKILEKRKPDLILLDIMMPEMDGYEVCRRIKADQSVRDIPIIFLTAKAEVEDETKGLALGAVDYITKPISPPILKARVRTQLQIKKQQDELKKAYHIIELQKKRMQAELNAGHKIQMSMVPQVYPPFPDRSEFSLYATLKPAREVGGDFYDFFLIDENHLCTCIGDVSGKGVPAALFMAITRTLIRALAGDDLSSAKIVTRVNEELHVHNKQNMFVTLFIGILNLGNGTFNYTNAGHSPSYVLNDKKNPEPLKKIHGIPIGYSRENAYQEDTIQFEPGEILFMYTDGVTEAHDPQKRLYGDQRLSHLLLSNINESIETIIHTVVEDVNTFEGNADQFDDITVMALKYEKA